MTGLPNGINKQNCKPSNPRTAGAKRLLNVPEKIYKIPYKIVQQSRLKRASVVA